jgi:outer membrane protein OmpA-like peptidoglycan-associated protein
MKNIFNYAILVLSLLMVSMTSSAENLYPQEQLAGDIGKYYPAPQFREDEGHPLRVVAYLFHPVGWLLREGVVRPVSYLFSTSETAAGIFGYKKSYGMERSSCLLTEAADCNKVIPYSLRNKKDVEAAVVEEAPVLPVPVEIVFPNVNFDFNSRKLNDAGKAKAKEVAALLEQKGAVSVSIEGHADEIGSDKYNDQLGLSRAESVKAELVSLGVSADKLSTVSFGESRPLINEKTPYARSMNRRVEVKVK